MTKTFSKIWIVIVLIVFLTGGIFAYKYWWMPKESEAAIEGLIQNFYEALGDQNGELLINYFTPPIAPEEKESYDWLTGADLPEQSRFYRIFLRVKISNPLIREIKRIGEGKFQVNTTDELRSYSNVTAEWGNPIQRNITFTVVKLNDKWLVERYIHLLEDSDKEYRTEKYSGFGGEEIVKKDETADLSSEVSVRGDWQIYRNEKYGYEIEYPSGCTINIYNGEKTEILLSGWTKDNTFFEIQGYPNLEKIPAREYFEERFSPQKYASEARYSLHRGKIKIAGTEFEVYDKYLKSAEPNAFTYVTLLNETFFEIEGAGQEEKVLQILNTLRFTDVSEWRLCVTSEYTIRFPQEWYKEEWYKEGINQDIIYFISPEYYGGFKDRYFRSLRMETTLVKPNTLLIDAIKNDLKKQGKDDISFSQENVVIGGENGFKIKFFCDQQAECDGPQWFAIHNNLLYHFSSGLGYSEIFDKIISTLIYNEPGLF